MSRFINEQQIKQKETQKLNIMKALKLIIVLAIIVANLASCKKDTTAENKDNQLKVKSSETTKKVTTNLNAKVGTNDNATSTDVNQRLEFDYCFNFVYPITLSYNNGTELEVTSSTQLLSVVRALTETQYINGIGFPFSIETSNGAQTIADEAAFQAAINSCDTDADGTPNYQDTDDDGDGIADTDEDTNGDGMETNDDTDGDGVPNYQDTDDDGDGVDTADEDVNGDGDATNDDTDGDGTPNYQDTDDDGDGVPTADEDTNGDGDATNDDSDGDGTPDYQDTDSDNDGIEDGDDPDADGNGIDDDQEGNEGNESGEGNEGNESGEGNDTNG